MALPDLLTVGEAFEDLIFLGLPMLPRPGEEVKTSRFVATVGGGAVISAVAAARLGLACRVITGVGDTGLARLQREGVSVANLRQPDEPHAISAALSTATNRSFVTFNGINDVLESRLPAALAREQARHVHFAFYPHSCALWEGHVLALKQQGVTTSWDFGWNDALLNDRRFPHLLRALDYVFFNEQEAVLYARRHDLAAALAMWHDAPMHVIVKLGPKGSRWLGHQVDLHVPTRRAKVVDTTGAGDAFNGGFLSGLLRGIQPEGVPAPRQLRRHALDTQGRRARRPARAVGPARGVRGARQAPALLATRAAPRGALPRDHEARDHRRCGRSRPAPRQRPGRSRTCRSPTSRCTTSTRNACASSASWRRASPARPRLSDAPRRSAEAVEGADYVFISIRVGGIEGRARDEAIALAHGIVGQETVGPGGFAMALRTMPGARRATRAR